MKNNIVLMGTDCIGKTTLAGILHENNYPVIERNKEIDKRVEFDLIFDESVQIIKNIILSSKDTFILLYTTDENILKQRLQQRISENIKQVTDYDMACVIYNELYIKLFQNIGELPNLLMLDITSQSPEDLADKIKNFYTCRVPNSFFMRNEKVCVRVKLFGEEVRARLLANGWTETSDISTAKYVFINTCGFLEYREEQHMEYINGVDVKETQNMVVFGCLPAVIPDKIKDNRKNVILLGREIEAFDEIFSLPMKNTPVYKAIDKEMTPKQKTLYSLNKILKSKAIDYRIEKSNLFIIEVSKGCLGNCSYCSEKFTTKLKSKTIAEISAQIDKALELGYKLISLKSDDMSAFGKDNGENIESLIEEIVNKDGDFYICLPEFNPNGLNNELIELLRSHKIAYITLPIQSASAAVLEKMNRYYDIDTVINQVSRIRTINPKIQINTHVIVGFNGETEEDFQKTLRVINMGVFDRIKVFGYSERNKTEASMMPPETKLKKDIINKRQRIMEKAVLKSSIKKRSLVNFLLNAELI